MPLKSLPIHRAAFLTALIAAPGLWAAPAYSQEQPRSDEDRVFVTQTPATPGEGPDAPINDPAQDAGSVYFPDPITPQAIAEARARAAQQEQLAQQPTQREASQDVAQLSGGEQAARDVDQLSDGESARALAQLTPAERQVLLEAVEGTDICDRTTDIPAIQALCAQRLETRSAEFASAPQELPETRLLGENLDAVRISTLESAIARLARNEGDSNDFSNQVIASVALGTGVPNDPTPNPADADPTAGLSAETQALVNAIVAQFGGQ